MASVRAEAANDSDLDLELGEGESASLSSRLADGDAGAGLKMDAKDAADGSLLSMTLRLPGLQT